MSSNNSRSNKQSRRDFLKTTATAAVAASAISLPGVSNADSKPFVAISFDPDDDKLTKEPPVQWATDQLRQALDSRGIASQIVSISDQTIAPTDRVIIASHTSSFAQ